MKVSDIQELLHQALAGDLEHGVKWFNENAHKEFEERYPLLCEAVGVIMNLEVDDESK